MSPIGVAFFNGGATYTSTDTSVLRLMIPLQDIQLGY